MGKVINLSSQFSFMSTVDLDARYFSGSLKNFASEPECPSVRLEETMITIVDCSYGC